MHLKYINKQFKGSLFNKMYAERSTDIENEARENKEENNR